MSYSPEAPTPEAVNAMKGLVVLEFGTDWCAFCRAAQSAISGALAQYPQVQHLKIEDGKGRALGRSFKIKLWPSLIFLADGQEVERVVRPDTVDVVANALAKLTELKSAAMK